MRLSIFALRIIRLRLWFKDADEEILMKRIIVYCFDHFREVYCTCSVRDYAIFMYLVYVNNQPVIGTIYWLKHLPENFYFILEYICVYRKVVIDQIKIRFHLYSKRPHMYMYILSRISMYIQCHTSTLNFICVARYQHYDRHTCQVDCLVVFISHDIQTR